VSDAVARRREAKKAAIVAAAWELAHVHGIAGISLRELARSVGMRQPSLYEYFPAKDALYDEMFADGNRQLQARIESLELPADPRAALKTVVREWIAFGVEDLARCALLFQRHLPGFSPSPASYAIAENALRHVVELARRAGVEEPGDLDCIIAVAAGLMDAQVANDPTGDRWIRHTDRLIDLLIDNPMKSTTQ
jgi:AcrR family transcriptional regulator